MRTMCKALEVSHSGYYRWRLEAPKSLAKRQERVDAIAEVYDESHGTYGSPRVAAALRNKGIQYNHKSVERLMQEEGMYSKQSKKFKATTNSKHNLPVAQNILDRKFQQTGPNQAWVSDITYVWTEEGWLYLAVFIDLWSRKVVGWSMSERMQSQLVLDAFMMGYTRRNVDPSRLLVHSDRGSQYASHLFSKFLAEKSCKQSMSRKGNCWDNAVSESFFGTIKKEMIYHQKFDTRESARKAIFDYIEVFYNRNRIHSALNYLTPSAFELQLQQAA